MSVSTTSSLFGASVVSVAPVEKLVARQAYIDVDAEVVDGPSGTCILLASEHRLRWSCLELLVNTLRLALHLPCLTGAALYSMVV